MTYLQKLSEEKWGTKRDEILTLDKHRCRLCGSHYNLQVHHLAYIAGAQPWNYPNEMLITLCSDCHKEEEKYKKLIGLLIPEITSLGIPCKSIFNHLELLKNNG